MKRKSVNRGKLLVLNSIISLISQASTVICGFVLTRLILGYYGSEVNGLTSSITQFLGFISFLEMGIGAVVKSALYKPLAENNALEVSKIIISCRCFYQKVAIILAIYTCVLMVIFPILSRGRFSWIYTSSLVFIISISLFAQYFFGIPYQLLLNADQRTYIPTSICCVTLIINTIISAVAMWLGASIHVVKLLASLIYIARPIVYNIYVRKHYQLDNRIVLTEEPLKQKWNGLAQHIAYVVVNYTDIVVLTLLSTLASVSVYTVYHNVTIGVQQIISSMSVGVSAMIGNILYSESAEETRKAFKLLEWFFHNITVLMFTITGMLIVPFVKVFTAGISDVNYIVPTFAVLITLAQASYSIRTPYETMVLAANHFKQTQRSAIVEALINIIVSVCLVKYIGLSGVAIGTLLAMTYRTVYFVIYLSKNIIKYRVFDFVKLLCLDFIQIILCFGISTVIKRNIQVLNWYTWIIFAIEIGLACLLIVIIVNLIFNRTLIIQVVKRIHSKIS